MNRRRSSAIRVGDQVRHACVVHRIEINERVGFMDSSLISHLSTIVGPDGVVANKTALSVYDCDGYTLEKSTPEVVVLPRSTDEVVAVVKFLYKEKIAF